MTQEQRTRLVAELWPALKTKRDVERRLLQVGIGVLRGLRESGMTIEEACRDIFNMDVYLAAKKLRVDPLLVDFLAWGMELEDVVELAPQGLPESYRAMERLLKRVMLKMAQKKSRPR